MNRKPNLLWCFLITVSIAAGGCSSGSVADDTNDTPSPLAAHVDDQQTSKTADTANLTLVTLDLPGMT